jgi:hypothetical protein
MVLQFELVCVLVQKQLYDIAVVCTSALRRKTDEKMRDSVRGLMVRI